MIFAANCPPVAALIQKEFCQVAGRFWQQAAVGLSGKYGSFPAVACITRPAAGNGQLQLSMCFEVE